MLTPSQLMSGDAPRKLPEDKMERLVALAKRYKQEKFAVSEATDLLAKRKAEFMRTEREAIPTLLEELGMKDFTLDDGTKIAVADDCAASLTDETRAAGLDWLIKNKHGGLIKTQVSVSHSRGEREKALELIKTLDELGIRADLQESVHHTTLKAFVRERLEKGDPIPMDVFNVFPYSKATIKEG